MKKLLILGGNATETVIVEKAKELGVYTIVTDNHEDWSCSPAKEAADEGWNISWSDVEELAYRCKECNVDGVLAGFSEFRVENMIRLCQILGLPCYININQLNITRNKRKFKDLCLSYDIPCVREFFYGGDAGHISFPVIIKPVDRAGSIGINVAHNMMECEEYYDKAKSLSVSGDVILEEFIDDGVKIDVYYLIQDGNVLFIGSNDTVMYDNRYGNEIMQNAWTFPSKYETDYLNKIDGKAKKMIHDLGFIDGYATMSAFYKDGNFYFFEAGFRLSGEMSFNYYNVHTGIDYLKSMILYSVGDKKEIPTFVEVKSCDEKRNFTILNFFGRSGKIGRIEGVEECMSLEHVISFVSYVKEGDVINNIPGGVIKKIAMCTVCTDEEEEMKMVLDKIKTAYNVLSVDGRDLIFEYSFQ